MSRHDSVETQSKDASQKDFYRAWRLKTKIPAITSTVPAATQTVKGSPRITTLIRMVDIGPTMPTCEASNSLPGNGLTLRMCQPAASTQQTLAAGEPQNPPRFFSKLGKLELWHWIATTPDVDDLVLGRAAVLG